MKDERQQILERLFDGESKVDDPRGEADDAESVAYLRRLSLLRELASRHDPAAAIPRDGLCTSLRDHEGESS